MLPISLYFVLPTVKEGYCNAVVEAMSCELPIIGYNLSFNWSVLNETNSIMIDSQDIERIRNTIIKLRDDSAFREKLANGVLRKAESLTIDQRAKGKIILITKQN